MQQVLAAPWGCVWLESNSAAKGTTKKSLPPTGTKTEEQRFNFYCLHWCLRTQSAGLYSPPMRRLLTITVISGL